MAILGILGWLAMAEILIRQAAGGRTHDRADQVPHHRAGLVLGCSKILANGRPNRFFNARVKAAAALHAAGKVDCLIVSGDNSRETYDEPTDLRDAATSDNFLSGVLDFFMGDEPTLLAFAASRNCDPARIGIARSILSRDEH